MSYRAPGPFVQPPLGGLIDHRDDPEENPIDANKDKNHAPTGPESGNPAEVSGPPHRSALFVKVKRWLAARLGSIALTPFKKLVNITFRGSALVASMLNTILTAMGARSDPRFTLVVQLHLAEGHCEQENSLTVALVHAQTCEIITQHKFLPKPADSSPQVTRGAVSRGSSVAPTSPDATLPATRVSSQGATTDSSPHATHDALSSKDGSVGDTLDANPEASQPESNEGIVHYANSRRHSAATVNQPVEIPRSIDTPLVQLPRQNGERFLSQDLIAGPCDANKLEAITAFWGSMDPNTQVDCTY